MEIIMQIINEFQLQITISDTGKGIDKDLGEKLFQNTLLKHIKK
jgi:signal transduction histidine kinase